MTPNKINKLATEINEYNIDAGWWSESQQNIYVKLSLVNSEIYEALEGHRKDLMDDKLPDRKMVEVELADYMIRLLDIRGWLGLKYIPMEKEVPLISSINPLPAQLLALNSCVIDLTRCLYIKASDDTLNNFYSICVESGEDIADLNKMDIWGAIKDKRKYNSIRADHKLENRNKVGGKKY